MRPPDSVTAEPTERLAPTGSRLPVWYRLPDEPPLATYPDQPRPDDDTVERPAAAGGPGEAAAAVATDPSYPAPPDPGQVDGYPGNRPAPAPAETKRGGSWFQTIVAGLVGAVLALAGAAVIGGDDTEPEASAAPAATPSAAPDEAGTGVEGNAAIADEVLPSIVTVMVGNDSAEGLDTIGSGSGVIISEDGLIVTNDHVVEGAPDYRVVLSDGRTSYEATLIGTDPVTDLAVLDIDAAGLVPIELGATTELSVGDAAVAVGSPLGLDGGPSVTVGVLSAFGRQVTTDPERTLFGMLQTDAPITQGSSGGALVDSQGRLIGITTAVGVSDVGVEGVGFATPVELMSRVVAERVADGSIEHAFLGIRGGTAFTTSADGAQVAAGVQIDSVEPGTAAADAGLEAGEIITSVDGEPLITMDELVIALRHHGAGDELTLTVVPSAGETPRTVEVVLGEL
jgi:putative serine protease PepD